MKRTVLGSVLTLGLLWLSATPARADLIFNVSVDTSQLAATFGPTLGIDFQLLSGGVATNTATISNFDFGGGTANPPAGSLNPGSSTGDLSSSVVLSASPSIGSADFNEGFTPGNTLKFQVDLSTNVGSTPDSFSFFILQNYTGPSMIGNASPIPTSDTFGSLVTVDLTSSNPMPQQFTAASIPSLTVTVIPAAAVPEPASLTLFAVGLATLAAGRRWQRRRAIVAA